MEKIDLLQTIMQMGILGVLLNQKISIFHSQGILGSPKIDKMGVTLTILRSLTQNITFQKNNGRLAMKYAYKIIVSTNMERFELLSPTYIDISDVNNKKNLKLFLQA